MSPEFWPVYVGVIVFIYGATIGSFLNVCIWRIPREESVVRPRSHCPGCGHPIAWYDNLPLISWLVLGAQCRHCRTRISIRYPLVELVTALLFLAVWLKYGLDGRTPVYGLVVAGLVLGTFVDIDHLILPDRVTLGGIIAGLLLSPLVPRLHGEISALRGLTASAVGAAVGYGGLWLVALVGEKIFRKEAMGMGDVKLMGAVGALMGWPAVLFTIFVSSLIGTVTGVALILLKKHEWQSRLAFGPFIAVAALGWILGGREAFQAYWEWVAGGGHRL